MYHSWENFYFLNPAVMEALRARLGESITTNGNFIRRGGETIASCALDDAPGTPETLSVRGLVDEVPDFSIIVPVNQ